MKKNLGIQAFMKCFCGLLLIGLLLFAPAGTFVYWNAWLLIGALFIPMAIFGGYLLFRDRNLLEKRLHMDEKESGQRLVILLSSLMFVAGFIIAALDFRFGWSKVPFWLVITAAIVFLLSYFIFAVVMKENAFLSRTVEIQENQTVIDTGLYGIVRHPMYFATVLLFCSMPLILGSWFAFLVFLFYPLILVKRIKNEEAVLLAGLPGYAEYVKKVKYRVIPFIW